MERIHFYVMKIIFVVFVAQTVGYNMIPTTTDRNKNDMNIAYFGPSFRIRIGRLIKRIIISKKLPRLYNMDGWRYGRGYVAEVTNWRREEPSK